ncbi:hypothetical protein [Microtetraspora fusca]|uniref:hypothetical protein n=1 Tax=Microtetraspora fusca TaxID=1997 RepID=UPI000833EAE0|nr:hypothetical protein [Microtetraspora fusca]
MGRALMVGLTVLVAGLAAAALWLGAARNAARQDERDRQAAVRAAAVHAEALLALDHRTVDQDVARLVATSTGQARDGYMKGRDAMRQEALQREVSQTGVLRAAGLVAMSDGGRSAEVLVVGDALIRWGADGKKRGGDSNAPGKPEERAYRWRMEVAKVGDRWLVSRAELVQ